MCSEGVAVGGASHGLRFGDVVGTRRHIESCDDGGGGIVDVDERDVTLRVTDKCEHTPPCSVDEALV